MTAANLIKIDLLIKNKILDALVNKDFFIAISFIIFV